MPNASQTPFNIESGWVAEASRVAALHELRILDTDAEQSYDDITALAARICDVPIALVSLVDEDRQWFKSHVGLSVCETAREVSFCTYAIQQQALFIIPDAHADPRFAQNPLVTGDPYIRFYAGAPLITAAGHALGSLCVIDRQPRSLTAEQQSALLALGRLVVAQMELRHSTASQQQLLTQLRQAHSRLHAVVEGTTDAIFLKDISGRYQMINAAGARFIGRPAAEIVGKNDAELFPAAAAAQTQGNDQQVLSSGVTYTYEDTETIEGVSRTYLSTKDVCRDEQGEAIGVIGISRDITDRKKADERLRLLAAALENANDVIVITEAEPVGQPGPRVVYVNDAFTRATGYMPKEILGKTPRLLQGSGTDPATRALLHKKLKAWKPVEVELLNYRKDGTPFWSQLNIRPVADENGWYTHWISIQRDVTERRQAEEEERTSARRREIELEQRVLKRTEELIRLSRRNQLLLDSAGEGIFGIDLEGRNTFVNPAAAAMLGYTVQELLNAPMHATLHHSWPDGSPYPREKCPIYAAFTDGIVHRVADEVFWRKDGTSFPVEYVSTPILGDGGAIGAVVTFRDISILKEMQAEQARLLTEALERADRDPLTGLLNHRAFQKKLEQEADRAQREGSSLVVALLDLDNFKFFNDAYGHAAGDDVLRQVAEALRQHCRSYDLIARFGGDEFGLILPGATESENFAVALRERLAHIGYRPPGYDVAIPIGATMGLAVFPNEAATRAEVLSLADGRLRRAKSGAGETEDLIAGLRARLPHASIAGFEMLSALVTGVDTKDRYTRCHSEDVLAYSLQIAIGLGLSEDTRQTIAVAALLHDVGKIGVPDAVLRKPGKLTEAEFKAIQQHPAMGAAIVGAVAGFEDILEAVRHHHERWDGGGYPSGLRGKETPLIARLMAVADAFSAMTTDRPYRNGMPDVRALAILEEGAGSQWDPACVEAFLRTRTICKSR